MVLEKAVKQASKILKNHNIRSHELDAQLILSDIMKVKRESLITNDEVIISEKIMEKYDIAVRRRIKGEPIAYITGKREFWSVDFLVNHETLIPRAETELLIYKLVNFFKNKRINILDIGTGSGCILLSILKEINFSRGIGIDISSKAIQMAEANSKYLQLFCRSKFKVIDLDKFNIGKYDLIVSNPPYIPSREIKNLSKGVTNFEPLIALDGGIDGLDLIKKVIYKSNHLLKRGGLLALEVGYDEYVRVSSILRYNGYRELSRECDYNHNVRYIISTKVKFF
jgi:release factor glutamine methyltransferase